MIFYSSGDYAGLEAGNIHFYYGYEYADRDGIKAGDDEWGFYAEFIDTKALICSYGDGDTGFYDEPFDGLIGGIGKMLDDGVLGVV